MEKIGISEKIRQIVFVVSEKIDQIFFTISPSFYSMLSGALIGAIVNLLTGLLFVEEILFNQKFMALAVSCLLTSAGSLAYVGFTLEQLQRDSRLRLEIKGNRKKLWTAAFAGFILIITSLFFGYCAIS